MQDAAFRRSFVTDKKDRSEKFSLFQSLQINKQQNQINFLNKFTKNFYKKTDDLFQYTKRSHILLLWNYFNF